MKNTRQPGAFRSKRSGCVNEVRGHQKRMSKESSRSEQKPHNVCGVLLCVTEAQLNLLHIGESRKKLKQGDQIGINHGEWKVSIILTESVRFFLAMSDRGL